MLKLEPGLGWADFDMRMDYVGDRASKTRETFVNCLQDHSRRARVKFSILSWRVNCTELQPATNKAVLARLTQHQIDNRTTRGTTPGLIDPRLPDTPKNRIPVPGHGNHRPVLLAPGNNLKFVQPSTTAPRPRRKRKIVTSDIDTDAWTDIDFEPMPLQESKRAKRAA